MTVLSIGNGLEEGEGEVADSVVVQVETALTISNADSALHKFRQDAYIQSYNDGLWGGIMVTCAARRDREKMFKSPLGLAPRFPFHDFHCLVVSRTVVFYCG